PRPRGRADHSEDTMADAIIEIVGQDDLPTIVDLYNQIYRPPRDVESFRRRFMARYNALRMIARVKDQPVGFFLGFELKPTTFFAWFYGVLPDFRRQGIATQLMEAVHAWAREQGYESVRSSATTPRGRCCTWRL